MVLNGERLLTNKKDQRWGNVVGLGPILDFGRLIKISVSGAQDAPVRVPLGVLVRSQGCEPLESPDGRRAAIINDG